MSGSAARIDEHYIKSESDAKVKFNQKHIVSKDFRDLTPEEVKEFVNMAKNEYYYYNKNGVHVVYGNELSDCKILVNSGSEVYWLPESYSYSEEEHKNKKHGDTITNDIPLEMKDTDRNVKGSYKEAIQQGIDVFIRVTKPMTTEYAITSIEKYIRSLHKSKNRDDRTKNLIGKLYLYFERTKQLTYDGYSLIDNAVTTISGVFGLGIVLFPCSVDWIDGKVGFFQIPMHYSNKVHCACAAAFFVLLAFNSYFLFTKTDDKYSIPDKKKLRNKVYRICGIGMLVFMVWQAITSQVSFLKGYWTMINEIFLLQFFGISWLVKGGAIPYFNDKELKSV